MKRAILLFSSCLLWALPFTAKAQERGDVSVFGGYSHRWNANAIHGWNASLPGNVTNHMALVADFSGYYWSDSYAASSYQSEYQSRNYSFLFGPRYVHTIQKRWTPFAHALVGLERDTGEGWYSIGSTRTFYGPSSSHMLALAFGGGIDIRVSNRISVRALQLDGVGLESQGFWGYYLRASFGAVIHLRKAPR